MNPQTSVKESMPAGSAAWIATALCHDRNIRSQKVMIVNEPVLTISGHASRSISAYNALPLRGDVSEDIGESGME
jgi:hypothetical protein